MRLGRRINGMLMRVPLMNVLLMTMGGLLGLVFMVAPLEAEQQAWLALGGFLVFLVVNRFQGRGALFFLVALSSFISMRYLYWRVTETLGYTGYIATFLGTGLLLAEVYAVLALLLSYFQQLWPLQRKPVALPDAVEEWPVVDIFIPSYNEPLEVVKPAVFGAMAMDWPRDKMNIYVLDDGRRADFRAFCEEVGCGYMIRPDNKGAKAGNINHALTKTNGEYIAIFDCDHVATRAFLQLTLGWMLRDKRIGMLQTPHHFYSPDPFERNLASGQRIPNEGLLFYGLVQQGNDLWNATFFCGSCAVLRRTALLEVGGVPTQTVTEDCHCSLKMQRLGWRTAYLRLPMAAGLATDRLLSHIGQRMRWARGMIQILRVENPMFGPGLNFAQRLCYLNAQWHFLFPLPRFVFLTSPLAFLLFGQNIIAASPLAILAYAGPHVVHSIVTNSKLQGKVRHSFWSEIYETVLALYLLPVVLTTLLDPSKGKFNVTDKGGTLQDGYFDVRAVGPNLVLGGVLVLGLMSGILGMVLNAPSSLAFQANALNAVWVLLSLVTVLAGLAVGRERRQVRERARIAAVIPAAVVLPDGTRVKGRSVDLSLGGAALAVPAPEQLASGATLTLEFEIATETVSVPAEALRWQGDRLQARFTPETLLDEGNIVRVVLGRADAWLHWDDVPADRPLRALAEVALSIGGLFRGSSQLSLKERRARRQQQQAALRATVTPPAGVATPVAAAPPAAEAAAPAAPRRGRTRLGRRAAALLVLALGMPAAAEAQVMRPQAPPALPPVGSPGSAVPGLTLAQATPVLPPQAPNGAPLGAPPAGAPLATPPAAAPPPAAAQATPPAAVPPAAAAAPAPGGLAFGAPSGPVGSSRMETRSLRQLGLGGPMQLRGTSDLQGVLFGIRGDEVVTGAKLTIQGATSPALIPELSQIAVTLNEQFVATVTPDKARPAFGPVEFPMNPVFFADANRLNFRFTGRYAVECNDPLSGLLWSTISDLSTVQLTLERLPLPRDLARLPEPFFDPRVLREPLNLPVVLPDNAGNDVVRAAAIASSWFAVQADYRGANFPVSLALPARGNAVVIATGPDAIPGLTLPRMEGPTLAVVPNPADADGLLLVVGGRNGADAAVAAQALAVGREALSGELALVQAPTAAPREPYDAPRWIRSDRPVKFGEMVDPSELQSYGFAPGTIAIPFRTAPDLYTWRDRALPVNVFFRAPPGPITDVAVSRLDAGLNNTYLRSFPLRDGEPSWPFNWLARQVNAASVAERSQGEVGLPPYLIFGLNDLQLRFDMRPMNRGDCVSIPGDVRASIDPDSTIDLSRGWRFAELPNLSYFAGAGFPYTRLADFGGTAAVLPERPNTSELSAFLTLLGRLSANVGHAATRIAIARPTGLAEVAERDLLLIGAIGRQPALADMLRDRSPLQIEGNRVTLALPDALEGFRNLFLSDDQRLQRDQLQATLAQPPSQAGDGTGMLIGFESPLSAKRSVVALTGSNQQGMEAMVASLRDVEVLPRIQGDLAVLSNGRITAYKINRNYTVGFIPPWLWPQYYLGQRPDTLLLMVLVAALLVAVPTYWLLRRKAARRLRTRTGH
ncbi:UDP-forming cellulose synthase catalytic subunit [Roseomonas haemaphysalidis]|uniref:Cellulose synthase catalytic subunit [UDP-forming] n=1 Tax=Roseomonas haemaphysalidis TaxID=2768162 RepID=A0ABS3KUF1_9PROT|nr:UDP-forming cellulose synthase catalytic subunit [Roseomonas haemaphysalidis]MBO1081097.1 UDP-forming cellulose synthase catalytic subunit [Roseomonas haemaphysalidis]